MPIPCFTSRSASASPVTETLRRAGQADIRTKMDEVEALFRAK